DFSVVTTHFAGDDDGHVRTLHYAQAEPAPPFKPVAGTEGELKADLVLLAMGFLHPEPEAVDQLGLEKDQRGNVKAGAYESTLPTAPLPRSCSATARAAGSARRNCSRRPAPRSRPDGRSRSSSSPIASRGGARPRPRPSSTPPGPRSSPSFATARSPACRSCA